MKYKKIIYLLTLIIIFTTILKNYNLKAQIIGGSSRYYFSNIFNFSLYGEYPLKYFTTGINLKYIISDTEILPFQYFDTAFYEKFGNKKLYFQAGGGISYGYNELLSFTSYFFYLGGGVYNFIKNIPLGIKTDIEFYNGSMNIYPEIYLLFYFNKRISIKTASANLLLIDFDNSPIFYTGIQWGINYEF